MNLDKMTVAELRTEISGHPRVATGDKPMPGLSKMRKAELIEILTELRTGESEQYERGNAVAEAFANSMLSGAIYMAGIEGAAEFTAEERRELNEAKYQGRYEGKNVKVRVGGKTRFGNVIDRVHRDSDPLNRGDGSGLLLLVVRHAAGVNRRSLHRAEDAVLV
jgi:hypothetical protein